MALELIRPSLLPEQESVSDTDSVPIDNGVTVGRVTPAQIVDAGRPIASESQAIAGTDNTVAMTPLTTRQATASFTDNAVLAAQSSANQAATFASVAQDRAADAEDSATAAQLAAISAGAPLFGSVGAALDDTSNGDVFIVQDELGTASYRNDLGASTFLGFLSLRTDYPARSDLVTAWPVISALVPTGTVLEAGGQSYVKDGGADIPDLSGLAPNGEYTVRHFGAGGGGDDTAAFSAAGVSVPALETLGPPNSSTVGRSDTAVVLVPAGEYTLTETVDTGNRDITWDLSPGAKLNGSDFINGRTTRAGLKVTLGYNYGIYDANTGFVSTLGGGYSDKPAPITGVANPAGLAGYSGIDGAAIVGASYSHPPLAARTTVQTAYTSGTLTITPALDEDQAKRLRVGQVCETLHATPYVGVVESWDLSSPSETVINIQEGWYERGNAGAGVQIPANTAGVNVGTTTKLWGSNFVVNLTSDGAAREGIGVEVSSRNFRSDSSYDTNDRESRVWGYFASAMGESPFKQQAGYMARGNYIYGYVSEGQEIGFRYNVTGGAGFIAFSSRTNFTSTILEARDTDDNLRYRIRGSGDTDHGDPNVASSAKAIRFRTAGDGADYDVRLLASGGSGITPGSGTFSVQAANMKVGPGTIEPSASFDLSSLDKGFMPPRMSTGARDLIPSPTSGLVIWNFSTSKLQVRVGAIWENLH